MPTGKGRKTPRSGKDSNARRASPEHRQAERDKQARIAAAKEAEEAAKRS